MKNRKILLVPPALLLLIFLFLFWLQASQPKAQKNLCDGYAWEAIGKLKLPEQEKFSIKADLLILIFQARVFSKEWSEFMPEDVFAECLRFVDKYYTDPANKPVPVFFAVKLFEKNKIEGKMTDEQLRHYSLKIKERLKLK